LLQQQLLQEVTVISRSPFRWMVLALFNSAVLVPEGTLAGLQQAVLQQQCKHQAVVLLLMVADYLAPSSSSSSSSSSKTM
jgi:hypothetical protein